MMPAQQPTDATICSNASSSYGQTNLRNNTSQQGTKVKAYVDFTHFNKNFEDYRRKTGAKDDLSIEPTRDKSKESDDSGSNLAEDWVVLNQDNAVVTTK